jgi:hypothetical protein
MIVEIITTTKIEILENGSACVIYKDTKCEKTDNAEGDSVTLRHVIKSSEHRFGILTFSKREKISAVLPQNSDIEVTFEGKTYICHTHSTTLGRIDRLTKLIRQNLVVDDEILVSYDPSQKKMTITKI